MAKTGGKMSGVERMKSALKVYAKRTPERVGAAIFQEAQSIMTEAKRRTPVDTGALRASGQVEPPEIRGNTASVALTFGGAAVDYAIFVHEDLSKRHPIGQAKFLESAIKDAVPGFSARVAARVQRIK